MEHGTIKNSQLVTTPTEGYRIIKSNQFVTTPTEGFEILIGLTNSTTLVTAQGVESGYFEPVRHQ
jgi:hypothetical protein